MIRQQWKQIIDSRWDFLCKKRKSKLLDEINRATDDPNEKQLYWDASTGSMARMQLTSLYLSVSQSCFFRHLTVLKFIYSFYLRTVILWIAVFEQKWYIFYQSERCQQLLLSSWLSCHRALSKDNFFMLILITVKMQILRKLSQWEAFQERNNMALCVCNQTETADTFICIFWDTKHKHSSSSIKRKRVVVV